MIHAKKGQKGQKSSAQAAQFVHSSQHADLVELIEDHLLDAEAAAVATSFTAPVATASVRTAITCIASALGAVTNGPSGPARHCSAGTGSQAPRNRAAVASRAAGYGADGVGLGPSSVGSADLAS